MRTPRRVVRRGECRPARHDGEQPGNRPDRDSPRDQANLLSLACPRWNTTRIRSPWESAVSGGQSALRICSSSGTSGSRNVVDRIRRGGDVVGPLEHRHLVGRERRARDPLGEARAAAGDGRPGRGRAAAASRAPSRSGGRARPAHAVGAAELERAVRPPRAGRARRRSTRRRRRPRSAPTAAGPRRSPSRPARAAPAGRTSAARRRRGRRRSSAGRSRTRARTPRPRAPSRHFAPKYGTASFVASPVPSALISTTRCTPSSRAAASTFAKPSTITRRKSASRPRMIATRCTTCVQPATARRTLSASVTSPSAS